MSLLVCFLLSLPKHSLFSEWMCIQSCTLACLSVTTSAAEHFFLFVLPQESMYPFFIYYFLAQLRVCCCVLVVVGFCREEQPWGPSCAPAQMLPRETRGWRSVKLAVARSHLCCADPLRAFCAQGRFVF